MGVNLVGGALNGIVRTTMSVEDKREHIWSEDRISFQADDGKNEYDKNIQLSELNASNAALAVVKWKTFFVFIMT
jgi:hypothetical protein